ncbi:MAG: hypothetical protein OK422_05295 [Thaumarchaeota archaeon]|nr:hypothetical protein [Nitrososphaerota archaeon]
MMDRRARFDQTDSLESGVGEDEPHEPSSKSGLDWRDYLAIFLAALQTVLLPIVVFILIVFVLVIFLKIV